MPRPRSARALTNDEAIRTAAVQLLFSKGIDSISFRDVGAEAGLTHGALYARFEDTEELLVDLWNSVLRHRAIAMITVSADAAANPTYESVHAVVESIRDASTVDAVTVQVLLASRRFPILHEEVESFIHDYLESNSAEVTDAVRSRALVVFALTMIVILSNSQLGPDFECLDFLEPILLDTLSVDVRDVAPVTLHEPTDRLIPPPKPDLRSQLTFHTFSAVGKSGYMRATISRISRRANCSPGSIYKIYPSKEDLTIAAIRAVMQVPWIALSHFNDILEEGALTQLLYSSASTQNDVRKSFTLEVAMASAKQREDTQSSPGPVAGTRVGGPPHFGTRREGERATRLHDPLAHLVDTRGEFPLNDHQGHRSSRLQPVRRTTASGVRRSGRSRVVRDSKATRRAGGAGSNTRITRSLSRSARRRVGSFSSPSAVRRGVRVTTFVRNMVQCPPSP